MGDIAALTEDNGSIRCFAQRLHEDLCLECVFLYGAFKRDFASTTWEYSLILVSSGFQGIDLSDRPAGLHDIYYDIGGNGALDLICLTPDEFAWAQQHVTLVREVLPEAINLLVEEPAQA